MTINEIKKDLFKSKAMATFTRLEGDLIYYKVPINEELHEFPIEVNKAIEEDNGTFTLELKDSPGIETAFNTCIKGSELNRWIAMAYDKHLLLPIVND